MLGGIGNVAGHDEYEFVDIAGVDVEVGRRDGARRGLRRTVTAFDRAVVPTVVRELVAQLGLPYAPARRRLGVTPEATEVVWSAGSAHPAQLLAGLRPDLVVPIDARAGVLVVDDTRTKGAWTTIAPDAPFDKVVRRIAASELVVTTSDAAVLVAGALGVPARRLGDAGPEEAIALGAPPVADWDPYPLLDAFPAELWGASADPTIVAAIGWRVRLALDVIAEPRTSGTP